MMLKYIYGLLIASGCSMMLSLSVGAAQIHTDVLPNSTVNLSYVSGGQLGSMSLTNHSSLRQFVPYSDTNGIPYTCSPLTRLSYLSNPIGQPAMRGASNRGLTVSCATQCGPLMRGTAYGDEANNAYCADGSPKTFVAVTGSTDKLHWTCGSSPTQCWANKGCVIEGRPNLGSSLGPIASTTIVGMGGGDIDTVKVPHNKAIQFGRGQNGGAYDDSYTLRCVGGKFYPHAASGSLACTTPIGMPFQVGGLGAIMGFYSTKPGQTSISYTYIYPLSDGGYAYPVFSIQGDIAYCDNNSCPGLNALDPQNNSLWVYGPGQFTPGTCPYTGQIVTF